MRRCLTLCLFCSCVLASGFAQTTPKLTVTAPAKQVIPEFKTNMPQSSVLPRSGHSFVQGDVIVRPPMRFKDMKARFGSGQCFTMHSHQFSKGEDPKQVDESTCTDAKLVRLKPVDQIVKPQDEIDPLKK